jgi:Protein of unknown function (DUF2510)
MFEYASVSSAAYDTTGLIDKINDQASSGWELVSIVTTGGDVTAILKREANRNGASQAAEYSGTEVGVAGVIGTSVAEPAGWGSEPTPEPQPVTDVVPPESVTASDTSFMEANEPSRAATSASMTPAGWYPDPSGRYEMRYWDGDKWTEHVSRQGQTYTDPPVA